MHQTILVVCLCTVTAILNILLVTTLKVALVLQTLGIGMWGATTYSTGKEVDMRAVSPSTAVATLQMATVV